MKAEDIIVLDKRVEKNEIRKPFEYRISAMINWFVQKVRTRLENF